MKTRLTAAFLIVAAWFTTLCVFAVPSHACCQGSSGAKASALKECCVSPMVPASLSSQTALSSGFGPTPDLASLPLLPFPDLNIGLEPIHQSALASRHIADQSGRYLELRVLLN